MNEKDVLIARIEELSARCRNNNYLTSTDFLSQSEQSVFFERVKDGGLSGFTGKYDGISYVLTGGWEYADRRLICFIPDYLKPEDVAEGGGNEKEILRVLSIKPLNSRFSDELNHRDYLGAIMNLGLERGKTGDILYKNGEALCFVKPEIAGFICEELRQVKHTSVSCAPYEGEMIDLRPEFEERQISISSERADAVVAAVYRLSRSISQELIKSERVFSSGKAVTDPGKSFNPGDRVSVRGKGKFVYDGQTAVSKKGRLFAKVRIYL